MAERTDRTELEVVKELRGLCTSPGYIHALASLCFRDNLIGFGGRLTSEDVQASYSPSRLLGTEINTLIGLMLQAPIDVGLPPPGVVQAMIDQSQALMEELHHCIGRPLADGLSLGSPDDPERPLQHGAAMREPIFYGGESAYTFQYRDLALMRYAQDEAWIVANKGFQVADAHAVVKAMSRLQPRKAMETLRSLKQVHPSAWTVLPAFECSTEEIASEAGIAHDVARAVMSAFTAPEAPTNNGFESVSDFNAAVATPILELAPERFVMLHPYGISEALYDSPFYWMAADRAYKDRAFANRGDFTERFVQERLSLVFGDERVHRGVNLDIRGRRLGEVDVLVVFADRMIVVQCKSKKLTIEARKGNDQRLRDDFKKSVQDSYDQGLLCAKSLVIGDVVASTGDGEVVRYPRPKEVYVVCVVSDHYPALGFQSQEFLRHEETDRILPPLVADVFLIDVLAEMLPSPLRFLSYLNRRVAYHDRVKSSNELTILSYHLQANLWLADDLSAMMIADEYGCELDAAMIARREGIPGPDNVDGVWTKLEGTFVGGILSSIEHREDAALVDMGFALLTLGGQSHDQLNKGIALVTNQARRDGRCHDVTLATQDMGFTVHCNPVPDATARDMLLEHCTKRKYLQGAKTWFGLVVRSDDGMPRFGIVVDHPWRRDACIDVLSHGIGPLARRHGPVGFTRKVGRNDPCPCGSGRKYKRCCLGYQGLQG